MKYQKKGFYNGIRLRPVPKKILEQSGLYKRLVAHGYSATVALAECRSRTEQNITIT